MTDVRPQAMALQNSITLDKKFGISIFLQTGQTRDQMPGWSCQTQNRNAATVLQGG